MIIDYDETVAHGRGHPTGLEHTEKMDVVACLLDEGKISPEEFNSAHAQFTGIFRHVLDITHREWEEKKKARGNAGAGDSVA